MTASIATSAESVGRTLRGGRRFLLFFCLVIVAAGGCGSEDSSSPSVPPTTAARELSEEVRAHLGQSSNNEDETPASSVPADAESNQLVALAAAEDHIEICMKAAGFSWWQRGAYTNRELAFLAAVGEDGGSIEANAEYVATLGYGISTSLDPANSGIVIATFVDPNAERFEALSEEEDDALHEALRECMESIPATEAPISPETEADLAEVADEVSRRTSSDLRVVAAQVRWSECMAVKGFTFASQSELYDHIEERAEPFVHLVQQSSGRVGSDGQRPLLEDILTSVELDELRELQAYEVAAAEADLECSIDLAAVYSAVYDEKMEEFLNG